MLQSRQASKLEVDSSGLQHRIYSPGVADGPQPTVVLVHGRAGSDKVMWLFSKALENCRPIVVSPQAPQVDPLGGFSWWELFHAANSESPAPKRTTEEDLASPLSALEHFIDSLPALYGCDPRRLYGFGFSQGAGLLASLSVRRPGLFRGVAMLSGFLPRIIHQDIGHGAERAELPSYFIAHGTKDEIIPYKRAIEARDTLQAAGAQVEFHSDEVGHKVGSAGIRALRTWIEELFANAPSYQ